MVSIRVYLVTDRGLRRVTTSAMLVRRDLRLPQYAGSRQRAIQATYEWRADALFLKLDCKYLEFDEVGRQFISHQALQNAGQRVWIGQEIAEERASTPAIATFGTYHRARELEREARWEPTDEDYSLITADLLGSARPPGTRAIPLIKPLSANA
jgi:hypothetical protein